MSARYAYLDHPGVLAFSHRGGTSQWPENTMPAFQHSIDLGFRYLETDVHLSADGVLYAFHDHDLADRTGTEARFGDLTAAEIDKLLVDGVAHIPRLDEILTTWPLARINIDTKSDATVPADRDGPAAEALGPGLYWFVHRSPHQEVSQRTGTRVVHLYGPT